MIPILFVGIFLYTSRVKEPSGLGIIFHPKRIQFVVIIWRFNLPL